MLQIKNIENFVKRETKNVYSVTHDFGHLKRTARGAEWFVKILGGGKHEQNLAYIAGLLHDIVRPPSQTINHAKASADRSREILKHFIKDKKIIEQIVSSIDTHGDIDKCKTVLQKAIIFSDKILEQMGAFIVFRRCMYVGECIEYKDADFRETVSSHFKKRLVKFNPDEFPRKFSELVKYQYAWPKEFWLAFQNNKEWAINIAEYFYECGRKGTKLEKAIKNFKPTFKESERYKKEALNYMRGKKFNFF